MSSEKPPTRRLSIDLNLQDYEELKQIAQKCGITMGRIVRQGIKMEVFFQEAVEKKEKVFIQDKEGKQHEVVFI